MTAASDATDRLSRALDQTGAIISQVRPEQSSLPTPCASWDVRALINHVVHDVRQFVVTASGGEWKEPGDTNLIGDDWAGAYQQASRSLLAAWQREGALDQTLKLPFGELPATWRVNQQVTDLVVHGWDIAKATGQPTDLDPGLGQLALDWARQALQPQFRGEEGSGRAFGPEVAVPDDAPLHDRLAGFFGRNSG